MATCTTEATRVQLSTNRTIAANARKQGSASSTRSAGSAPIRADRRADTSVPWSSTGRWRASTAGTSRGLTASSSRLSFASLSAGSSLA